MHSCAWRRRRRRQWLLLAALVLACYAARPASAKRCTPNGPAYDIDGRFKQITGWRLSPQFQMADVRVLARDACPRFARPGLAWCCQYISDWGGQTSTQVPRGQSMAAAGGGACLSEVELMMAGCLAQEGCSAFSGGRLYLRPAATRGPNSTWTDAPAPPHWRRCAPREPCPPTYVLADLGPRPYGRGGACTRSFQAFATGANPDPTDMRRSYATFPNHYRRAPVYAGAGCAQFEGYVGGKLPYSVLDSLYNTPTRRFTWATLDPCPKCTRARPPRGAKAACSLCR